MLYFHVLPFGFLVLCLVIITPNGAAIRHSRKSTDDLKSMRCDPIVRQQCWPPSGRVTCPEYLAARCVHCDECKNRAEPQLFKAQMIAASRLYIEIPDDGNCMFSAVAAAHRSHLIKVLAPDGADLAAFQYYNRMLYDQGVNGRSYRKAAAAIIKDKMNGVDTAETRALPDMEWDIIFFTVTEMEGRSKEQYLHDVGTHAAPGQLGSRYWGGEAALAALAVITNARLVVYNAIGKYPSDSLLKLTTPKTWDGVDLTIWFNKADGTGRSGTHYDAFTALGGPSPVMDEVDKW